MPETTIDQENLERQWAYARIQESDTLRSYATLIFGNLLEEEPDWQWIATAPEPEVLAWAEGIHHGRSDLERQEEEIPVRGEG